MKKNFFAVTAILFASFTLFSCSSDKDEPSINNAKELLNYPYSGLSVADQKKKLSAESEVVIKKIEGLSSEKSLILLSSFESINSGLFDVLGKPVSRAKVEARKAIVELSSYFGEYAWNETTQEWLKSDTEVKDKLILNLPAVKGGKTNDGKIEVTAITSTVIINGREVPSNVVAELFVSDKKEGEVTVIATGINESTFVETADINVVLGTYKLVADVDKKGAKNEAKVEFSKGSDIILNGSVDLEANITVAMLDNKDVSSVKDGNAVVTITNNLATAGYVDGKSLAPELKRIDGELDELYYVQSEESTPEELQEIRLALMKERTAALNAYTNLALVSTTEEYKVAKISFGLDVNEYKNQYSVPKKDKEGNLMMDEWGNVIYERREYTAYSIKEMRILNFSDETKVDAEVFFGEGFEKVLNMWNDFVAKFN